MSVFHTSLNPRGVLQLLSADGLQLLCVEWAVDLTMGPILMLFSNNGKFYFEGQSVGNFNWKYVGFAA
jgi:hypothetical protein